MLNQSEKEAKVQTVTLDLVQGCVQQPISSSLMPMLAVGETAGSMKTGKLGPSEI